MEKKIRVGFIGAGTNTRTKHLPGFKAIPGVECAVVCNRRAASSRAVAEDFGIPRVAENWREVVEDPKIDAVCIGTWPMLHCEATVAALQAGKHVLCEARMGMNLTDAQEMVSEAKQHPELVSQLVPAPMSLDFDTVIANTLEKQELGEVREIAVTVNSRVNMDGDSPMTWRQDMDLSGCNVLQLGIYYEMIQRWFPHEMEWIIADAEVFTQYRQDKITQKFKEVRIPDSVSVVGRFEQGTRLTMNMSGVDAGLPVSEIRIHGTDGSLRIDFLEFYIFFARLGRDYEMPIDVPRQTRRGWKVEEDFVDSIRNGNPVKLTSFDDGLKYMRFTQRVYNSWSNGSIRT